MVATRGSKLKATSMAYVRGWPDAEVGGKRSTPLLAQRPDSRVRPSGLMVLVLLIGRFADEGPERVETGPGGSPAGGDGSHSLLRPRARDRMMQP